MIDSIKEIVTLIRDIGIIVGVPTLIIIARYLYRDQISILEKQNSFLRETQYDRAASLLSSQEVCFKIERENLEKERDELLKKLDDKSVSNENRNKKIAKLNMEIEAFGTVKKVLLNKTELEVIRKLKLILNDLKNPKELIEEYIFISGTYGYNIWPSELLLMLKNGWVKKLDGKIQITDAGIAIAKSK